MSLSSRLLTPLTIPYAIAVKLRNGRYDRADLSAAHPGIPVISVGNITTGGTGKTPIVIEIVRQLSEQGRRPAIVTRGYGAEAGQPADEVLEFGEALPEVPVVVDADRVRGARQARSSHNADCVVLDDGFQHRRLPRDLDVVVIDALSPWGGGQMLPAGRLREPLSGLKRADLFIISRSNQVSEQEIENIERGLDRYQPAAPIVYAELQATGLVDTEHASHDLEQLAYSCLVPVCGIGNPATFLRLLHQLAGHVAQPLRFRDHHRYTPDDVRRIVAAARLAHADLVVTTRKDWVKLAPLWRDAMDQDGPALMRLDVRLELAESSGELTRRLIALFGERAKTSFQERPSLT